MLYDAALLGGSSGPLTYLIHFQVTRQTGLRGPFQCPTNLHPQGIHDTDSRNMESDSSTNEELVDRLLKRLVRSSFDTGKDFWPRGCIEEIITPEAVTEELQSRRKTSQLTPSALVDFIMKEGQMTFAIALCSSLTGDKLPRAMIQFKDLGFNDSRLPINDGDDNVFYPPPEKGYKSPWTRITAQNFRLYQCYSLAPVFDNANRIMDLHPKTIFPFTHANSHGGAGTFGEVLKIAIHPEHQMNGVHVRLLSSPFDSVFAVLTCHR